MQKSPVLTIMLASMILIGCTQKNKNSIYNFDNYTFHPTTYVENEQDGYRIYKREWTNCDVLLSSEVLVSRNNMGFGAFLVPMIYTYSGDCRIHPSVGDDFFVKASLLGEVFTYRVFEDPSYFRNLLIYPENTPESKKYGPYYRVNVPSEDYGRIPDVLVTPLAASFIIDHSYNDSRKVVLITFAQDAIYHDSRFPGKKELLAKAAVHGIIALADSEVALAIECQPKSMLWDARNYVTYFLRYD